MKTFSLLPTCYKPCCLNYISGLKSNIEWEGLFIIMAPADEKLFVVWLLGQPARHQIDDRTLDLRLLYHNCLAGLLGKHLTTTSHRWKLYPDLVININDGHYLDTLMPPGHNSICLRGNLLIWMQFWETHFRQWYVQLILEILLWSDRIIMKYHKIRAQNKGD